MSIRKVSASAGAEWLLEAFRLLKKSPLGFGLLALIYAGLMLVLTLGGRFMPEAAKALQLVFIVIGPLIMAGMVYAAHEVDEGRSAAPAHLLASIRTGKAGRVLTTLIPQFALLLVIGGLLYLIVGQENIDKLSQLMMKIQTQAQTGTPIDPQLILELPTGRLLLWLMSTIVISLVMMLVTLTVIPDMMFTDVRLLAAMKRSFAACTRNLPALFVFIVIGFMLIIVVSIGFGLAIGALQLVFGNAAQIVGNALANGFFICFIAGAMYFAWKQMLGTDAETTPAVTGIEV